MARQVSQTGDWQASSRRTGPSGVCSRTRKPSRPVIAADQHGMIQRVAEQVQGQDRVDPRRLDAAPSAVGLLAGDDPLGGAAHGAERGPGLTGGAVVELQRPVQHGERRATRPRRAARAAATCRCAARRA